MTMCSVEFPEHFRSRYFGSEKCILILLELLISAEGYSAVRVLSRVHGIRQGVWSTMTEMFQKSRQFSFSVAILSLQMC